MLALTGIAMKHLRGWDCLTTLDASARAEQRERAIALGADR